MTRRAAIASVASLTVLLSCSELSGPRRSGDLQLEIVEGDLSSPLPINSVVSNLAVRVTDGAGRTVPGIVVGFTPTKGNGLVLGGVVYSNADGVATIPSWQFGTIAGTQQLVASVISATVDASVTFSATALPLAASRLALARRDIVLQPTGQIQLVAGPSDEYRNPTGPPVAATWVSDDPTIAGVSATGLVTGVALGPTRIIATSGGQSDTAYVGVGGRPSTHGIWTLPLGGDPWGVAIAPQGTVLVTRLNSPSTMMFEVPSFVATPSAALGSSGIDAVFESTGNLAYVLHELANPLVSVVDRASGVVTRTIAGPSPGFRIAIAPGNTHLFVSTPSSTLHRIQLSNDAVTTLAVPGTLNGLEVDGGRGVIYVSSTDGMLYEVSLAGFNILRSVNLGGRPQEIVRGHANRLYVANENLGLQVVDLVSFTLASTVSAIGAFDVGVTRDGMEVFVTRPGAGSTCVINALTLMIVREVTGSFPRRVAVSADGTTIAITNQSVNSLGSVQFIR